MPNKTVAQTKAELDAAMAALGYRWDPRHHCEWSADRTRVSCSHGRWVKRRRPYAPRKKRTQA